jgi:cell division protein FtsZ
MLFITAGMGGGTGTGAAPVIAQMAREMDILTVAIVTLPFSFEGRKRRLQAEKGIEELKKQVDTLLIISNEKLREIHGNLKLSEAFGKADDILTIASKGIAEIITVTGYINVDFEDVKTVMKDSGTAIMGSATAEGEDRAKVAVREALASPLLNDNKITGASDILLYISSGSEEITFDEVTEITDYIQNEAGQSAEVIWGNGFDESLGAKISITLIATGFMSPEDIEETTLNKEKKKTVYSLGDALPNEKTGSKTESVNREAEAVDEGISEIQLVKKDGNGSPPQNKTDRKEKTQVYPSLFDQPDHETLRPDNKSSFQDGMILNETHSISNKSNGNLRIKHTIGSLATDHIKKEDEPSEMMHKKNEERRKKLLQFSFMSGKASKDDESLEKIPAYVRKNVELKPVAASSESNVARYTLGEDEHKNVELESKDIPYIHNKPD